MFPLELLADLPNPRNDEPASLRIDIADELTDHLVCAFRREVLRDGDEAAARRRTLDRFGDPKRLARRLWRQAMWSRIMRQRIVSALQWSVAVLAMLISTAVLHQQSQMLAEMRQARQEEAAQRREDSAQRQALTARLDQLQLQARVAEPRIAVLPTSDAASITLPPTDANYDLEASPQRSPAEPLAGGELRASFAEPEVATERPAPTVVPQQLTVKLVQGTADGPPVTQGFARITMTDNRGVAQAGTPVRGTVRVPATVEYPDGTTEADSVGALGTVAYGFDSLDPGHYELRIELPDGQSSLRTILVRDAKPQELTIVCPESRQKASLQVTLPPIPEDLRESAVSLDVRFEERPVTVGGADWAPPSKTRQVLSFDAKTGKAKGLVQDEYRPSDGFVDLRNVKAEDCLMFVASGPIGIRYELSLLNKHFDPQTVTSVDFPTSPDDLLRTAEPGENRWQLELPDELLAAAREQLRKSSPARNAPVPYVQHLDPNELTALPRKPPQLTIKCVPEGESGSRVKVQNVTIRSADVEAGAERVVSGEDELYVFPSLPPDQYELTIVLADAQNQMCTQPLLVEDEKPRELKIVCPGPRKKVPVKVTMQPLPEKLLRRNYETVELTLFAGTVEIGKNRWSTPNLGSQTITFDARTGLPRSIEITAARGEQHFDLIELPEDERRVFLPVGTVFYHFRMHERIVRSRPVSVFCWPKSRQEEDCLKHVVNANEKSWKLELPQEYLSELLSELNDAGEEASTTLRKLQGTWRTGGGAGDMNVEIAGTGCRSWLPGKQPGDWLQFKLDVSHDPCWIDIDAVQGVFRLKDDELILCIGPKRPSGLDPAPGEQVERYVLKRDRYVPKPAPVFNTDSAESPEEDSNPE